MGPIILIFVLALIHSGFSAPGLESSPDGDILIRVPKEEINEKIKESELNHDPSVYWRDWKKKIPADAVIGGYSESDCGTPVPIVLAQVSISASRSGLQPVSITGRSKTVKPTFAAAQHETNEHVKILCSDDPDTLTWVHLNKTKDFKLDDDCVIAGHELDFNIFFGRTTYDDETMIAKALPAKSLMYFPYMGKEKSTHDFEILCYKRALTKIPVKTETKVEEKLKSDLQEKTKINGVTDENILKSETKVEERTDGNVPQSGTKVEGKREPNVQVENRSTLPAITTTTPITLPTSPSSTTSRPTRPSPRYFPRVG